MGDVIDLEDALLDSAVVNDIAEATELNPALVRRVLAELADVPVQQAIRICTACREAKIALSNRMVRLGR